MYTREQVRAKLASDDRWLLRGLVAIYRHQMNDEQEQRLTKYKNNVGFNAADAPVLTEWAKAAEQGDTNFHPTALAIVRSRMLKYAGQLARIANNQI